MNGLGGYKLASVWLACMLLNIGCSTISENSSGIPEIQGVWRYSEGALAHTQPSLTYEFQQDHFRVNGYPNIYAHGKYSFEMSERGGYQVVLAPEASQGFEVRTLQIQATGGRILLIDRKTYRRILRN